MIKIGNEDNPILEAYAKNPHSAQRGSLSATPLMSKNLTFSQKGCSGNKVTKVENDRVTVLEHYAKNPHSAHRGS